MMNWDDFTNERISPRAPEIVGNVEKYRESGVLEDCVLRDVAEEWSITSSTLMPLSIIAVYVEAYRQLALRYIEGEAI